MRQAAESRNMRLVTPRLGYCVDNAAMIAHVAHMRIRFGVLPSDPSFTISPKALRTV
jgi:tRNA A37 threonylcarbamoyltransferase TsaD